MAAHQAHFTRSESRPGRWFFVGMAFAMIATSIAGFLPAIIDPGTRRAPLTLLAGAHGIVFFMWLFLYLAQSLLIANRRVALHRRLGLTSAVLLPLMIVLGFTTTTAMIRRGFDLSGDQHLPENGLTLPLITIQQSERLAFLRGCTNTTGITHTVVWKESHPSADSLLIGTTSRDSTSKRNVAPTALDVNTRVTSRRLEALRASII